MLVHVLLGAIHARAWGAGLGDYHAGETWLEPTFAYDITESFTKNSRLLEVVVVVPFLVASFESLPELLPADRCIGDSSTDARLIQRRSPWRV